MPTIAAEREIESVDVLVLGGGLAGSSAALLLRRAMPEARVLIIERSAEFERKVGEATVELSAFFFAHVLRLHRTLSHEHLPKHGLRYFFTDGNQRTLAEMTEVGGTSQPSLASFQLDRARFDEAVLHEAQTAGAELVRPGQVAQVEHGWPHSRVEYEVDGQRRVLRARWVVDASGRHAHLARRMGLHEAFDGHDTASIWGHWRGTLDLDGAVARGSDPARPRLTQLKSSRGLATVHFTGRGWWVWVIPLSDGATSIGLVHDTRLFEPPPGASTAERYESFLRGHDGLREIVADAQLEEGSVHLRNHLAYRATRYMGRGWALVGDAASFLDPYYSPGLDHLAISVYASTRLIIEELRAELEDERLGAALDLHNERFERSTRRWFEGIYRDKYELFGDAELTAAAFYIDTAMYYLGVVQPAYRDIDELRIPVLGREGGKSRLAYRILRFVNRRLVALARNRQARGTYGRRNVHWSSYVRDFGSAELGFTRAHRKGLRMWLGAELHNVWTGLGFGRNRRAAQARAADARAEGEAHPQGSEA